MQREAGGPGEELATCRASCLLPLTGTFHVLTSTCHDTSLLLCGWGQGADSSCISHAMPMHDRFVETKGIYVHIISSIPLLIQKAFAQSPNEPCYTRSVICQASRSAVSQVTQTPWELDGGFQHSLMLRPFKPVPHVVVIHPSLCEKYFCFYFITVILLPF